LRGRLRRFLEDLRSVISLYPDVPSIARRMFTTNSFDGIMASIGVNVGGYTQTGDPLTLALSIMGGGISMGVMSGMLGVYLSERAERLREVREVAPKVVVVAFNAPTLVNPVTFNPEAEIKPLVKDAPIPAGGSLVIVGGDQKMVIEPTNTISVSADNTVDVVLSVLEIS